MKWSMMLGPQNGSQKVTRNCEIHWRKPTAQEAAYEGVKSGEVEGGYVVVTSYNHKKDNLCKLPSNVQ